jgi:hypothetical protein
LPWSHARTCPILLVPHRGEPGCLGCSRIFLQVSAYGLNREDIRQSGGDFGLGRREAIPTPLRSASRSAEVKERARSSFDFICRSGGRTARKPLAPRSCVSAGERVHRVSWFCDAPRTDMRGYRHTSAPTRVSAVECDQVTGAAPLQNIGLPSAPSTGA